MKEVYVKPVAEVIYIESIRMFAISEGTMIVNSSVEADEELSNKRRGEWGNLWSE